MAKNVDKINYLIRPQKISNEIFDWVKKRESYRCYNCGTDGRELKLAFLSTSKSITDLNNLVAICDYCYDDVTENEVLIDGTIVRNIEDQSDECISWRFLIHHVPEFESNSRAYQNHLQLLEEFNEVSVIKALAVAIYNITSKGSASSPNGLYGYARAVLNNYDSGDVHISKAIENKYDVIEWIKAIK